MADKEENKNSHEEKLIPIYDDDAALGEKNRGPQLRIKIDDDDTILDEKPRGTSPLIKINEDFNKSDSIPKYNGETLEKEFAKAAKDGTLYERYSEYLKRYEGMLRNPDLKQLAKSIKIQISQLKAAYFDAAGLSRKICPECGQIHEKNARFSTCHGSEMYVVGKCRSCGADLSSAHGYSAINSCPKCGAELTAPQKRIINEILVKNPAKTKYICSKCGKVYDSAIRHCQDCGSKILTMQCGKCGEVLRQNEEGIFDKYCPVCGMLNPAEVEKINQKKKEQLQKQAEEAEKRRLVEAEKERIRQEYEEKLKAAYAKVSEAERKAAGLKNQQGKKWGEDIIHIPLEGEYEVGDKITFGSYPFYEDGTKKAIDWIILDIDKKGNALVISDYCLDNVSYNEQHVCITWENSSIRKWLNETFINKAFTPEQRGKIIESRIENKDNARWNGRGGNATNDKLFLLSIEEADKYFSNDKARIAYPTPYAKSKNSVKGKLWVSDKYVSKDRGGSCWWWLRSPGFGQSGAAYVGSGGGVNSHGGSVYDVDRVVRVALKINLNNL